MKPSLPQGTRDFNADVLRRRNYIFQTIKNVFELYGFQPLETPAMENLETLTGKYGDEGDKLIFRILDSGNPFLKESFINLLLEKNDKWIDGFRDIEIDGQKPLEKLSNDKLLQISTKFNLIQNIEELQQQNILPRLKNESSDKALRYDLTIPFARYVAMNYGQLNFPFKRYQIQPVWRADRPQKGRYREFYQCDADIVGSNSLLNEVEFANMYAEVFKKLNVDVEIKINNRKILMALAELCGGADKIYDITVPVDKLDKIGWEKVKLELAERNLTIQQIELVETYINISGSNNEKLNSLRTLFSTNETGKTGIEELEYLLNFKRNDLVLDLTLARGLNYYTGTIFEVKASNIQMGSIGGGGRYDDLTGLFGVPNIPGVGISFGVDRIFDVMNELHLFPENLKQSTQVLFFNLGDAEVKTAYDLMQQLRKNNISCEIYSEKAKFDKQFKYAEKKSIGFTIIIGSKELETQTCIVKNLTSGVQTSIPQNELIHFNFNQQ